MRIEEAVDDFLLACRAEGLSQRTVKWYGSILRMFVAAFPGQELADFTTRMIRGYLADLRARDSRYVAAKQKPVQPGGLSESTIKGHIVALHRFWAWSQREYQLAFNPMSNIRRIARKQSEPKGITPEDIAKLFAVTGNDLQGIRNRAILALLLDTGCRSQGLCSLTDAKLNLDERIAIVAEKGRPARQIFFTERTAEMLRHWLSVRPENATTLFCSLGSNTFGQPLTYEGLYQMLQRLKVKAGVKGRVSPHRFRHHFAREYIKNGGDLATLSRLMGHSDVSTTANFYAVFSAGELASSHDRFSPANRLDIAPEQAAGDEDKD